MWIVLACAVVVLVGVILAANEDCLSMWDSGWTVLSGVFGFALLGFLITIPLNRTETGGCVAEFCAVEWTLNEARSHGEVLENAALMVTVAECNAWLAEAKFYNNKTQWGWWVPDAVNDIQPIK